MCFSPVGDLLGGAVVVAIGVDACLHMKGRTENWAIATFPLLLGLHQIDETFVWWRIQGHVSREIGNVAMWIYLVFALVAVPSLVPSLGPLPLVRPRSSRGNSRRNRCDVAFEFALRKAAP